MDAARIRAFIEAKLAEGVNPATIRIFIAILSALFVDLTERGIAQTNPAHGLPRSTMRLMRPTHDPRTTPFIEKLTDVRRIYLALPQPLNVAYAIGALAGLRTGEVFALRWQHVDLATRRAHLRESVRGPLKDKDSRMVPILDALAPILAAWQLKTGGEGLVIPPLRCDGEKIHKHTPGIYLRAALKQLGLTREGLGWYEATRHTFASQWVMAGGSIEKLKEILGHYSVVMTERYAHLRPDLFPKSDLGTIRLDLTQTDAEVVQLGLKTGSTRLRTSRKLPGTRRKRSEPPCKPGAPEMDAPDTAARSTAVNTAASTLRSIAAATAAESISCATWTQNGPQPRGVEALPRPTADLFAQAGAILSKRAARGGATDFELATIVARSSAQAARLVLEGAPSALAEQRGQRHGP